MMGCDYEEVVESYEAYLKFLEGQKKTYGKEGPPVVPEQYPVLIRMYWIKDLRSNDIALDFYYMKEIDGEWYVKYEVDGGGMV